MLRVYNIQWCRIKISLLIIYHHQNSAVISRSTYPQEKERGRERELKDYMSVFVELRREVEHIIYKNQLLDTFLHIVQRGLIIFPLLFQEFRQGENGQDRLI